tara:strand:- start:58 stop:570 length:513 start_codon:yes stop_codon:yes gene_type:complete
MNPITRLLVFAAVAAVIIWVWSYIYTKRTGKPFIVIDSGKSESTSPKASRIEGDQVTLEQLQGEWRMLECGKRGRFAPIEEIALANVRMLIDGTNLLMVDSGEKDAISLDESTFPTEFDQVDDDGAVTRGIARFLDGQLELCQADAGKPRPSDFSRARSNPNTVVRFTRI